MANKVTKAQPKPLAQAYLILSNKKVEFGDRISIVELFFPDTQMRLPDMENAPKYKAQLATVLWQTLHERGFRLNSTLERQYQKQLTCIWCGGTVITYGGGTAESPSWEIRCSDCDYVYDED